MSNKQFFRDSLLPLSVLLALLRLQWDPVSQQHRVEIQGFQDIFLGESAALTETQFHQWHSTYDDVYVHPKMVDSGVYSRSIFRELHTLNSRNRLLNLIPSSLEITTLLLDNDELFPNRNIITSHSDIVSQPQSNVNVENLAIASSDGDLNNNFEAGAVASPGDIFTDLQDLSPEDADIIEALWMQDIDMGITRGDRFPNKMEVEIEKPEPTDKQIPQFDIDCETGEYLPRVQPPVTTPATSTADPSATTDEGSVFENFLTDLLDGYSPDGGEAPSDSRVVPQLTDALEIEQRWQDLASISEFQTSPLRNTSGTGSENFISSISQNSFPNTTWNNSLPSSDQNVFAFNATTNGNVNLQNATFPQLPPLFNNTDQPLTTTGLLPNEDLGSQFLSSINDTQMNLTSQDELFSPINRFNDMSISRDLPASPASSQGSSINLTMLMMDQQALDLPPVDSPQAQPRPTSASPVARPNGSLLLELLNATDANSSNASDEMDADMQELDSVIEMLAANNTAAPMDLLSDDDSFSIDDSDSVEGATGFNRDIFKGEFKRYNRGGDSPCYSDAGSSSSYDSSGNADNIHHNHSYAASSDSESMKGGVRSSNGSRNGTSDGTSSGRISRDQRRAKELGIPFDVDKIINLPVDSFNELVKQHDLNNEQMQLIRDIRRRGKNKVAAQNCRKRKISAIHQVEGSVGSMQNEHDKLLKERDKVTNEMDTMQERYDELYQQVFRNMTDRNGEPVDPREYRLEIMDDGSVILVPRNDTGNSLTGGRVTDKESNSN